MRLGGIKAGDVVVVVECGIISLLCLQIAILAGATKVYIIEPQQSRHDIARRFVSTNHIYPDNVKPIKAIKNLTNGLDVDVVLEAGGNPTTISIAPQLACKVSNVMILGLHNELTPINFFPLVCHEITIKGSFSYIYNEDFADAVDILGSGKVEVELLISTRISLDDIVKKELNELLKHKSKYLKILVSPRIKT